MIERNQNVVPCSKKCKKYLHFTFKSDTLCCLYLRKSDRFFAAIRVVGCTHSFRLHATNSPKLSQSFCLLVLVHKICDRPLHHGVAWSRWCYNLIQISDVGIRLHKHQRHVFFEYLCDFHILLPILAQRHQETPVVSTLCVVRVWRHPCNSLRNRFGATPWVQNPTLRAHSVQPLNAYLTSKLVLVHSNTPMHPSHFFYDYKQTANPSLASLYDVSSHRRVIAGLHRWRPSSTSRASPCAISPLHCCGAWSFALGIVPSSRRCQRWHKLLRR